MEFEVQCTREVLEECSYRYLQQTAKKMGLPSNVKKICLIQLIEAKKRCTPSELDDLINKVKMQRQQNNMSRRNSNNLTKVYKKNNVQQQSSHISSTSDSKSPPISSTSKRKSQHLIRYSPDHQPKYIKQKSSSFQNITVSTSNSSDRILRSCKTVKQPNYIVNNATMGVINATTSKEKLTKMDIMSTEEKYQKLNIRSYVNRKMENRNIGELVPATRSVHTSPPPIQKLQRNVSGLCPLSSSENVKIPNVIVRRPDGGLSKINAIIQNPLKHNVSGRREHTVSNVDSINVSIPDINDMLQNSNHDDVLKEIEANREYFHKKIRAEQIRSQRTRETRPSMEKLPNISEAFTIFNQVYKKDLTQPIYVQVSESELNDRIPYAHKPDVANSTMLERLFNLKNSFLVNQPLLQIYTTNNTTCTYSTPVMTTAKPQPPITSTMNDFNIISLLDESQHYDVDMEAPVRDIFNDLSGYEGGDTSLGSSSLASLHSQELGANVTIPELVEDALELISQDGDYMERIETDIQMQCMLCHWAGPKIILERHIRREHSELVKTYDNEWCIYYSLGMLLQKQLWISRLVEKDRRLYVLSAKCEQPDCFMATLSTLTSSCVDEDLPKLGRITIYNKVTGEPYMWEGEIQQIQPSLPYENNTSCLKIELSSLNLLPNSANLKLMNGELVMNSTNKVVVGQPELNNIYVMLTVKLLNC